MYQAAICDDDEKSLHELSARIGAAFSDLSSNVAIETFSSVESMLKRQETNPFDVYFLDIDLPEMDGVDVGAYLRGRGSEACIVFISNREERVYDTFKVDPVRFVRKSRFQEEIDEAVVAVSARLEQHKNRYLVIASRGKVDSYAVDDILYVECLNKNQSIVTRTQTKTTKSTMNELESKLLHHGFISPHKSYIVNYRYIDSIDKTALVLKNGKTIPISKYKLAETKKGFLRLVSSEPAISAPRVHKGLMA